MVRLASLSCERCPVRSTSWLSPRMKATSSCALKCSTALVLLTAATASIITPMPSMLTHMLREKMPGARCCPMRSVELRLASHTAPPHSAMTTTAARGHAPQRKGWLMLLTKARSRNEGT